MTTGEEMFFINEKGKVKLMKLLKRGYLNHH